MQLLYDKLFDVMDITTLLILDMAFLLLPYMSSFQEQVTTISSFYV